MIKNNLFALPNTNIHVLTAPEALDFFDKQSIYLTKSLSALEIWGIVMSHPMPILNIAFRIRDIVSSMFGVKKIGGFSGYVPDTLEVGQMIDFFFVEHVSQHILTLTERDRHLDVMICISFNEGELAITSSVKIHNTFGRIYMLPVAPLHKLIVRNNLKRIQRRLE